MKRETTLSNSFHGSSTTVRMTADEVESLQWDAQSGDRKAARKARDIRARLCGSKSCTCSGVLGIRK